MPFPESDQRVLIQATPQTVKPSASDTKTGNPPAKNIAIEFDCTVRQNHVLRSSITRNPIENGSFVTDHIVNLPVVLEIESIFTDTPISKLDSDTTLTSYDGRARELYEKLLRLRESKTLFQITTGLQVYENCVFEKLDSPKQTEIGHAVKVTGRIVQIPITSKAEKEIKSSSSAPETEHSVGSYVDLGLVVPEAIELPEKPELVTPNLF